MHNNCGCATHTSLYLIGFADHKYSTVMLQIKNLSQLPFFVLVCPASLGWNWHMCLLLGGDSPEPPRSLACAAVSEGRCVSACRPGPLNMTSICAQGPFCTAHSSTRRQTLGSPHHAEPQGPAPLHLCVTRLARDRIRRPPRGTDMQRVALTPGVWLATCSANFNIYIPGVRRGLYSRAPYTRLDRRDEVMWCSGTPLLAPGRLCSLARPSAPPGGGSEGGSETVGFTFSFSGFVCAVLLLTAYLCAPGPWPSAVIFSSSTVARGPLYFTLVLLTVVGAFRFIFASLVLLTVQHTYSVVIYTRSRFLHCVFVVLSLCCFVWHSLSLSAAALFATLFLCRVGTVLVLRLVCSPGLGTSAVLDGLRTRACLFLWSFAVVGVSVLGFTLLSMHRGTRKDWQVERYLLLLHQ